MVVAGQGLPERVTIYEVGPRDGLQNEKNPMPTDVKAEFVRRLVAAGLETVETTSFVNPAWVPQLADAGDLLDQLGELGRSHPRPVLVPNERGLDRALEAGVDVNGQLEVPGFGQVKVPTLCGVDHWLMCSPPWRWRAWRMR